MYRNWRIPEAALEELDVYRYQPEVGAGEEDPNDGLLHIQIYFKTKRQGLRYTQLNALFGLEPYQAHWEPARQFAAAYDYCGKEDTRLEGGEAHDPGFDRSLVMAELVANMRL